MKVLYKPFLKKVYTCMDRMYLVVKNAAMPAHTLDKVFILSLHISTTLYCANIPSNKFLSTVDTVYSFSINEENDLNSAPGGTNSSLRRI